MSKDEQARDHHAIAWSTFTRALQIFSASCSARSAGVILAPEAFTIMGIIGRDSSSIFQVGYSRLRGSGRLNAMFTDCS